LNLFYLPEITSGHLYLDAEESRHVIKVLRKVPGDELTVTDGKGAFYEVRITTSDPKKCEFEIIGKKEIPEKSHFTHIAIAPTKNADRMEWFVEKSVEIGIDRITFFQSKNSERKTVNLDRVQKIAISAMKQSQQARLPAISGVISFLEAIKEKADQKFIAYVDFENPMHLKNVAKPNSSYLVLIGPEGDFSKEEIDLSLKNNFEKVSLGPNRLRTETAGVVACHLLRLAN
jgi:16S rRNA (uracil1498-N3)-methyltransferase